MRSMRSRILGICLNTLLPLLLRKGVKVEVWKTETGSLYHAVTHSMRIQ